MYDQSRTVEPDYQWRPDGDSGGCHLGAVDRPPRAPVDARGRVGAKGGRARRGCAEGGGTMAVIEADGWLGGRGGYRRGTRDARSDASGGGRRGDPAGDAGGGLGGYRDAHPPPLSPPGDGPAPVSADEPERPTPALVEALERHLDARVEELADLRARLTVVEEQVNWLRTQVRVQQRAPEGGDDASNRKLP